LSEFNRILSGFCFHPPKFFQIHDTLISKFVSNLPVNWLSWLVAFKYYLLIAPFITAPIILTVDAILFKPFLSGRIKRQKQYYSGVN